MFSTNELSFSVRTLIRRSPEGTWETQLEHGNWEHALLARPQVWEHKLGINTTAFRPELLDLVTGRIPASET
jgi:hypothetical protein